MSTTILHGPAHRAWADPEGRGVRFELDGVEGPCGGSLDLASNQILACRGTDGATGRSIVVIEKFSERRLATMPSADAAAAAVRDILRLGQAPGVAQPAQAVAGIAGSTPVGALPAASRPGQRIMAGLAGCVAVLILGLWFIPGPASTPTDPQVALRSGLELPPAVVIAPTSPFAAGAPAAGPAAGAVTGAPGNPFGLEE